MNAQTDQQLLRDYAGSRSEAAFAELVRRHIDLVYSAALRMVCDSHQAEDVTQGVFVALAQNARQLTHHPVLSGWLHRTTQNLAANAVRTNIRRQTREQEAAAMNELLSAGSDVSWEHIASHLDAALGELSEPDRDALLLRYFERKSAREMAQPLGITDEAAQKRVARAVERLREFFAKRGVTVGAGGLVVVIAANAVQAAPVGLALTISTAVALAGTTIATTATVTATKAIAMTTLQKTLVTATVAAGIATLLAIQHQSQIRLRSQSDALRQQVAQLRQSASESVGALPAASTNSSPAFSNEQLNELLRLRGEVARLRRDSQELAQLKAGKAQTPNDPATADLNPLLALVNELKQKLNENPALKIPELDFLTPQDWLNVAANAKLDTDSGARQALSRLRAAAKLAFAPILKEALTSYVQASGGQLPAEISQLKPYFNPPLSDAFLDRYQLLLTGKASDVPAPEQGITAESGGGPERPSIKLRPPTSEGSIITEKAKVDADFDSVLSIGLNGSHLNEQGAIGSGLDFVTRSTILARDKNRIYSGGGNTIPTFNKPGMTPTNRPSP